MGISSLFFDNNNTNSVLSIEIIKNLALSGVGALIFMNSSASIFPISLLRRYIKSLNQDAQVKIPYS